MDIEFIKKNYFEIILCLGLTIGGIYRLLFPEIRNEEMKNLPMLSEFHEYLIAILELTSVFFIFMAGKDIKNIYLGGFVIGCLLVTIYYLSQRPIYTTLINIKRLCIFPNDIISIWYHLIYVFIIIYLIYIKN